ncbi:membrane hypothetical protein [Candidatus Sulfopaludibacter sp. SbA4]|nr:membrane hypothetical protein [Candidatus Sulfopaludibacter sp. SbA4]
MRSIHIAEWILALVTSRDRAASTVGDLVEEAATRGVFWFWSGVLRTAASLLWRDVAERPARMAGLAFRGLAIELALSLFFLALSGVTAAMIGSPGALNSAGWRLFFNAPTLVIPILIGRMLARWAPGHELAACLAYAILGSIFNVVIMIVFPAGMGSSALLWGILGDPAQQTPLLAGAVWGRRSLQGHRGRGAR